MIVICMLPLLNKVDLFIYRREGSLLRSRYFSRHATLLPLVGDKRCVTTQIDYREGETFEKSDLFCHACSNDAFPSRRLHDDPMEICTLRYNFESGKTEE